MGKKKITEQSPDAAIKEKEKADAKAVSASAAPRGSASKKQKKFQSGRVYIKSTYNNTVVSVTDSAGNVIAWASAGSLGFSGPKKATPFASSKIIAAVTERLKATGPTDIHVIVRGVGSGRDSAIRSLINQGFNVLSIRDVTPIPHNGPRPKKVRRV
ncbi:MAG: 30S ribosomal protein S11 [Candidatus Liptonbacteria bacterium]|nr:30S ribosomal protein S11 [Candidatus Liptonbacteria bacterium]